VDEARRLTERYSRMALLGASTLVLAGGGLAWSYLGSWSAGYGTPYGVMVVTKCCLLLVTVGLGAGNWLLVRRLATDPESLLARLRRVGEAEIALGFLAVLTAASRLRPESPRLTSPHITALASPSSIAVAVLESPFVATAGPQT
jgi:putative copper resistance protein D